MADKQRLATKDELKQIRDWLGKIPYVDIALIDDNFLQHYFLHRRGSLMETKEYIHNFFKSCLLSNKDTLILDPTSDTADINYKSTFNFVMPNLLDGAYVTYHSICPPLPSRYAKSALALSKRMSLHKIMTYPPQVNSNIYICDLQNYSAETFAQICTPTEWGEFLNSSMKSISFRMKSIHLINASPMAQMALQLVTQFMGQKYKERFVFHVTMDTLYKYVPKSHLPSDLGGDLGTRQELHDSYNKLLKQSTTELVKWQESFLSRHGKFDKIIGAVDNSSFRKLEID